MIHVRTLKDEEYPLLKNVADGIVLNPKTSVAIAAFNGDGEIVGRMFLVVMPHLEGTWVREDSRNGVVGGLLHRCLIRTLESLGLKKVLAFTSTEKDGDYMKRLGYRELSWKVWEKEN